MPSLVPSSTRKSKPKSLLRRASITECDRCLDVVSEERVRVCRTGLELGVELAAEEPRVVIKLDDLHQFPVRPHTAHAETRVGELVAVVRVHFEAMTMTLADASRLVGLCGEAVFFEDAGVGAKSHLLIRLAGVFQVRRQVD